MAPNIIDVIATFPQVIVACVELLTRYSNNPTLLNDLKNARQIVLAQNEDDEPELGGERRANGRRWVVAQRLAADGVQAVLDGYRAGGTARELAERFGISESSVKRLVRRAGCAGSMARAELSWRHRRQAGQEAAST
jgi:hypothetical protein